MVATSLRSATARSRSRTLTARTDRRSDERWTAVASKLDSRLVVSGRACRRLALVVAFASCVLSTPLEGQPVRLDQYRVLVMYSARREAPAPVIMDQVLQRVLGKELE